MKAARLHAHRPPRFVYEDAPEPRPEADEVLVRVYAAAVTPTELLWLPTTTTQTGTPRPLPIILGHELSGTVAAVGDEVGDFFAVGAAVYGMSDWYRDGANAEYCVARAGELAAKPATLDHAHAAATPMSALTAWQGLVERAKVARGERVLIHGASGAVGLFAVQLARRLGAHVIGTASAANLDLVRRLGADEVLDYRTTRFDDALRSIDVVFDTVGGETFERSWKILSPGGRIVTIAAAAESATDARTRDAFFIVEPKRDQLVAIAALIDAGELEVFVDAVLPLADAAAAYARKPVSGKIVLRTTD